MSAYTGANLFFDALERYGIRHLFGNPGTTELPLTRAASDSDVEYVLALHEDVAVGAAAGYATNRLYGSRSDRTVNPVGVVNLHNAPGLAHGLGNLYGAHLAGAPLVVTAGTQGTDFQHEEPKLYGDHERLARPFTKWSAEVKRVSALPTMIRRAVRTALTPPTGPVFLALPVDVMNAPTDAHPERLGAIPTAGEGDSAQLRRAVDVLANAERVVLVIGDDAGRSRADVGTAAVRFAEASGARVYGEIMTSAINFPTDHPRWISALPSREVEASDAFDADVVVLAGCSTNTLLTGPESPLIPATATTIYLGDDGRELGKNYPADVAVLGDTGTVLDRLARGVSSELSEDEVRRRKATEPDGIPPSPSDDVDVDSTDAPISKSDVVDALRSISDDVLFVDESVSFKFDALSGVPLRPDQYIGNKGAGLGYGLPAAVGAALEERQRSDPRAVVGIIGDGSYLYYPQAIYTAVDSSIDLTVVVPNNRSYQVLKDNMVDMYGGAVSDYDHVAVDFEPPVDIAGHAASTSADSRTVDSKDEIEPALDDALETTGPSVIDIQLND